MNAQSGVDHTFFREIYQMWLVRGDRRRGNAAPVSGSNGGTVFGKPYDFVGTKTFGSVANYFSEHGWRADQPVMEPAIRADSFEGPEPSNSLELGDTAGSLARMGYVFTTTLPSDAPAAAYSFEAEGGGSEYSVGYHNFRVVTRYNRSTKYALAAHQLSQAIRTRYLGALASNTGSAAP